MTHIICIAAAAVTAVVTWVLTRVACRASAARELSDKDKTLATLEAEIVSEKRLRESEAANAERRFAQAMDTAEQQLRQAQQAAHEQIERERVTAAERLRMQKEDAEARFNELKQTYDKTVAELKDSQARVMAAVRNELALENEKTLKAREESLRKEAEETMKSITGGLDQNIKSMREAFEAQKKSQSEESSSIKTKFDETVSHLRTQVESIGSQASDLAKALKGKNKMQGIFGETILENILKEEGLTKGRDYDPEYWLRDRDGKIMVNEDTGRKMRPDFALHYPDDTDVLVDSKVSLSALADYFAADNDEERADASRRNLESVMSHVRELSGKEYQKHVKGRKTLDYVIMFIPNYGAYQLAKQEDPEVFAKAFGQNVLITTEETLIPFLRLIRSAWVQKEQQDNMKSIVDAAQKMVDRVALFIERNNKVKEQLRKAGDLFEENTKTLNGRLSIVGAANEVLRCGVSLSKGRSLPDGEADGYVDALAPAPGRDGTDNPDKSDIA